MGGAFDVDIFGRGWYKVEMEKSQGQDLNKLVQEMGMEVARCRCGCGEMVIRGRGRAYCSVACKDRAYKRRVRKTKNPRVETEGMEDGVEL